MTDHSVVHDTFVLERIVYTFEMDMDDVRTSVSVTTGPTDIGRAPRTCSTPWAPT